MSAFVIDENVLIIAEKEMPDEHTDDACIQRCIQALRLARENLIVLDESEKILKKYIEKFKPIEKGRAGFEIMMWLFEYQCNPERCERVKITPLEDSFAEVPLELRNPDPVTKKIFDLDDHIWLAAAKASTNNPTILNATDTDWHEWRTQLEQHDFKIEFLCPDLMT
jgi:hypothetical protein